MCKKNWKKKRFKFWKIDVACEAQFKHRSASNGWLRGNQNWRRRWWASRKECYLLSSA